MHGKGTNRQTDTQTDTRTSRLLDQLGPEGRVGGNCLFACLPTLRNISYGSHDKRKYVIEYAYKFSLCKIRCIVARRPKNFL